MAWWSRCSRDAMPTPFISCMRKRWSTYSAAVQPAAPRAMRTDPAGTAAVLRPPRGVPGRPESAHPDRTRRIVTWQGPGSGGIVDTGGGPPARDVRADPVRVAGATAESSDTSQSSLRADCSGGFFVFLTAKIPALEPPRQSPGDRRRIRPIISHRSRRTGSSGKFHAATVPRPGQATTNGSPSPTFGSGLGPEGANR